MPTQTAPAPPAEVGKPVYNWAETDSCLPQEIAYPETVSDVVKLVRRASARGLTLRMFGARHSPSDIFCSNDLLVSLDKMQRIIKVEDTLVTCEAGIRLKQLNSTLPEFGLAMKNLGSIDEQSFAGAISTGTHGTGRQFGIVATTVEWMELVTGTGDVVECSPTIRPDLFQAARCGLGCIGVITKVAIRCEPAFRLHARQYGAKFEETLNNLDSLINGADHSRFHYYPHTEDVVVWKASRTTKPINDPPPSWTDKYTGPVALEAAYYAATFAPSLIPSINQHYATKNSAPSEIVNRSDLVFNLDCLFKQFVNEWSIPVEHTAAAMRELRDFIKSSGLKVHFPIEVRFVKEDDIWMSPAYGRVSCYIGIIQYRPYGVTLDRAQYWQGYESIMKKYNGRPHWAKTHPFTKSDVVQAYPKFPEFLKIREQVDPKGVFVNDYIRRTLLEDSPRPAASPIKAKL